MVAEGAKGLHGLSGAAVTFIGGLAILSSSFIGGYFAGFLFAAGIAFSLRIIRSIGR